MKINLIVYLTKTTVLLNCCLPYILITVKLDIIIIIIIK